MSDIDQTARDFAQRIISNPAFRLTTAPAAPDWLALDRGMLTNSIRGALQAERDAALEEAAEICDYRIAHGDKFAEQIRALKSTPTGKDSL